MHEIPHLHAGHYHLTLLKLNNRMKKQRITGNLNPLRNLPRLTHGMRTLNNKSRRNIPLHLIDHIYNLSLGSMLLRHRSGMKHKQTQAAGKMPGINHRYIFKRLCRLKRILIPQTGILSHRNMNHILGFRKLLRKKPLIVLHTRRLRVSRLSL